MGSGILYCLTVMGKGKRRAFDFEKTEDAYNAFDFLVEQFSNEKVTDKNEVFRSKTKITQLTVTKTYVESESIGAAMAYSPEEWFNEDAFDAMLASAEEYYQKFSNPL